MFASTKFRSMKKFLLLIPVILFFLSVESYSQTVYVNQSGSTYHTKACKLYTPNFEAVPLWKAKGPYAKRPCPKCKPPTRETGAAPKKKAAPKAKAKPAVKK
jgi:hypothetical protein